MPRSRRTKIDIKDIDELRDEICSHIKGDRQNAQIARLISKSSCKHEVTFAD